MISDRANSNSDPKNLVMQDSTGGMVVRFTANHSFDLGDKVTVDLSGQTLTSFNGLLQAMNVPSSAATAIGTGTITRRTATIAQINTTGDVWESTLLTIVNVTFTGGTDGTYSETATFSSWDRVHHHLFSYLLVSQ